MDLLIQANSRGIRYEGYDNDFIQCVFEDANVDGRNERYEFRCRPDLECCGRICCIPQENVIPLWLMILFIILGLLILSALLCTMVWFLRKIITRNKPHKAKSKRTANQYGYRSYKQNESPVGTEKLIMKEKDDLYSTPTEMGTTRGSRGYRNPMYTTTSTVKIRETFDRTIDDGNVYDRAGTVTDTGTGTGGETTGRSEMTADSEGRKQLNTAGVRRNEYQVAEPTSFSRTVSNTHSRPQSSSGHYSTRETFEERLEENYTVQEEGDRKELL
uniref:CX domain-containing protein n=1 Tax=Elaeophora elaphi TaxID=1147741 RepID=A0A0R3RTF3_9BILA